MGTVNLRSYNSLKEIFFVEYDKYGERLKKQNAYCIFNILFYYLIESVH